MNGQTIVNEINRKLNGEFEVVEFASDDWNTIVSALNENIDLYNKSANWRTSYNPNYTIGTVGTDTQYKLKLAEISTISGSDRAFVLFTDSNKVIVDKYKLVGQDIFDAADIQDKVVTLNSLGLQIKPKTTTGTIYGKNIVIPAFINVKNVTKVNDIINTDDNYWLVIKTAADLAASSPVSFIFRNATVFQAEAVARLKIIKKNNMSSQASTPAYGGWNPMYGNTGYINDVYNR